MKIFVSHNRQDGACCHQLVAALRGAGADVWYDQHNMEAGRLGHTIQRGGRVSRKCAHARDVRADTQARRRALYGHPSIQAILQRGRRRRAFLWHVGHHPIK
jgi:hypothetical protein